MKTTTQSLGHKNQTVCPIKTPFEIWIHFCEPVLMTPKKNKIILADFLLFLINFHSKRSTHLQNDFFQKSVIIHSEFLGKKLSFDAHIHFLKSTPMGDFLILDRFEDNYEWSVTRYNLPVSIYHLPVTNYPLPLTNYHLENKPFCQIKPFSVTTQNYITLIKQCNEMLFD